MANSDKNILITPSVGLSTNPTIKFNGANNTPTTLRVLDDGTVSFEATAGQLFSISDGLTGSIFSVNDISGIPSIEVLDTGLVKLNQYGGSTVFGSSAAIQNASSVNAKVSISTVSATTPGLIIKGVSSQSANLQEWQNSSGSVLARIKASGNTVLLSALTVNQSNTAELGDNYGIGSFEVKGTSFMIPRAATGVGLIIRGFTSQTANLQEWQNSSGTILAAVSNIGTIRSNIFANTTSGLTYIATNFDTSGIGIVTSSAAQKGLIVRGSASQTANLQEWQNSSSNIVSSISPVGRTGLSIGNYVNNATTVYLGHPAYGFSSEGAFLRYYTDLAAGGGHIWYASPDSSIPRAIINNNGLFTLRGISSQTADLQQWQNSSGTVLSSISSVGAPTFGSVATSVNSRSYSSNSRPFVIYATDGTTASERFNVEGTANAVRINYDGGLTIIGTSGASYGGRLNVTTGSTTLVGLAIRGVASQTANLQEWQNSSGTILAKVSSAGQITSNIQSSSAISTPLVLQNSATGVGTGTALTMNYGNNDYATIESAYLTAPGAGGAYLALKTKHSTTSTITTKLLIDNQGTVTINGFVAGAQGLIIKGAASQTANLQEWQNSSGTTLVSVSATGQVNFQGSAYVDIYGQFVTPTTIYTNGVQNNNGYWSLNNNGVGVITARTSTYIPLTLKGATSQSANLQEWQNSSGTVLAKVDASGNFMLNNITMSQSASSITATNLGTTNNRVYFKEENSGGQVRLTKSTASAANNRATDMAQLYLRDGTTAGTLKLVIIAGASGAETTILDNIPQS